MMDEYLIGIMRKEKGLPIVPRESPEEKAKRIGVPVIPVRKFVKPDPYGNPTIAICGECGIELKQIMGYSCSRTNCPTGLGPTSVM